MTDQLWLSFDGTRGDYPMRLLRIEHRAPSYGSGTYVAYSTIETISMWRATLPGDFAYLKMAAWTYHFGSMSKGTDLTVEIEQISGEPAPRNIRLQVGEM